MNSTEIMHRYAALAADLIKNARPEKLAYLAFGNCGVGAIGVDDSESFYLSFTTGKRGCVEPRDRQEDVDCYLPMPFLAFGDDANDIERLLAELSPRVSADQDGGLFEERTPEERLSDLMQNSRVEQAVRDALLKALADNPHDILGEVEAEIKAAIERIEEARDSEWVS